MNEKGRYALTRKIDELEHALQDYLPTNQNWFSRRRRDRMLKKLSVLRDRLAALNAPKPTLQRQSAQNVLVGNTAILPLSKFEETSLTDPQLYFVFSRIDDETTLESLCQSTGLDSDSASEILVELEAHGLVEISTTGSSSSVR